MVSMPDSPGLPVTLPRLVYEHLISAFATHSAEQLTRRLLDTPGTPRIAHPSDAFGNVLAWMRAEDPRQVMLFLAHVMVVLRNRNSAAGLNPPVTLDELPSGLKIALPHDFTDYDQLVAAARREVPGYYGSDPSAPGTWQHRQRP
jgi:hypothetical protein